MNISIHKSNYFLLKTLGRRRCDDLYRGAIVCTVYRDSPYDS